MGFFRKFGGAVIDLVKAPFDALGDIIREPSKRWDHQRSENSLSNSFNREKESKELEFEHQKKLKELEVELSIKEKTGVSLALVEIEELKKDKEHERMIKTSESIKKYLEELTKLKTETIKSIGEMHLELKEKAQDLVYRKTVQYKNMQDEALANAMDELTMIEERFSNNEQAKSILISAVDSKLSNIINTAHNFLMELNRDIENLNNDISFLTKNGQSFIENHLNRISVIGGISNGCIENDDNLSVTSLPNLTTTQSK